MTLVDTAAPVMGEEHWTNKGADVTLALWNKRVADRPQTAGRPRLFDGGPAGVRSRRAGP